MIRQAKKSDNQAIAELSYIIWKDMELPIVKQFKKSQVIGWLKQSISDIKYRTYFENVWVYEVEGKVAGCIIAYQGKDELALEANWNLLSLPEDAKDLGTPLPLKEAKDDELYIETVAVFPEYRGKGIATSLMHAVIDHHKQQPISLSCDFDNEGAYQLYQRLGFKTEGSIDLYGHMYHHMVVKK